MFAKWNPWSQLKALRQDLSAKIDALETRINGVDIEPAMRANAANLIAGQPNYQTYLATRFREYEMALLNVKQMGYQIGLKEAERFDREYVLARDIKPETNLLGSKLCTQSDCESDWYVCWLKQLRSGFIYHRKLWEFCYIAQQIYSTGNMRPGKTGLGFGCGSEPLPSLFASFGAASCGTDLDTRSSAASRHGWIEAGSHTSSRDQLLHRNICADEQKLALISHDFVDMNAIGPEHDGRYDFCWSACALEHLGTIQNGLDFVVNSLRTLRPGGVAVHTTEFNLAPGETIDNWVTVLFQRHHIVALAERLEGLGYLVAPLDFDTGSGVLDGLFDIPPWPWDVAKLGWTMFGELNHLKRTIDGIPCTSIGLTVRVPE